MEKITFECLDEAPPPGSPARDMFQDPAHGGEGSAMEAFLMLQYTNLSACDHARALVALLRASSVRSTALATITRGALESFSRSWFILQYDSTGDMSHRLMSLLHSDLKYPVKLGEELFTRGGKPVNPEAQRKFIESELARFGLGRPSNVDISRVVGDMLDSQFRDFLGRRLYSSLSAVAHGHRLGINTFIVTDHTGGVSGLAAPREVVLQYASMLVAAHAAVLQPFIELFGSRTRHLDLADSALRRAEATISNLRDLQSG